MQITPVKMTALFIVPFLSVGVFAQDDSEGERSDKIAWYATWDSGMVEAARSGRPILLMSAAPHCKNVSGIW